MYFPSRIFLFLFIISGTRLHTCEEVTSSNSIVIPRSDVFKRGYMSDFVYTNEPVNIIYQDKESGRIVVFPWAALKKHLLSDGDVLSEGVKITSLPPSRICKGDSEYAVRGKEMAYAGPWDFKNKLSAEESLALSVYHNADTNALERVSLHLPFRSDDTMAAEEIERPKITLFSARSKVPELEFDFGRVNVTVEAAEDDTLSFVISDCYKGFIDSGKNKNKIKLIPLDW